jgi:hypothetical protein
LGGALLYYIVLAFNLAMTFLIGEPLLGTAGILIHLLILVLLSLKFIA